VVQPGMCDVELNPASIPQLAAVFVSEIALPVSTSG